jgi:hypothetical protein
VLVDRSGSMDSCASGTFGSGSKHAAPQAHVVCERVRPSGACNGVCADLLRDLRMGQTGGDPAEFPVLIVLPQAGGCGSIAQPSAD